MFKFSQIKYMRPDMDAIIDKVSGLKQKFENAVSVDEQVSIYTEIYNLLEAPGTMMAVGMTRYYLNTEDKFYAAEQEYFDEIMPKIKNILTEFSRSMLNSPFKEELKVKLPALIMQNKEIEAKAMNEKIVPEMIEDAKLITEYTTLMSKIIIDYDGKKLTPSQLGTYLSDSDRNIRQSSMEAYGRELDKIKNEIDDIFDRMVKVRNKMAKKMGYKDYVELGYYMMMRNSYNTQDVAKFRQGVLKHIVPTVAKLKQQTAKKLGIKQLKLYDNDVFLQGGKPKPIIDSTEIMRQGSIMYHELNAEIGSLYDNMVESETFDVLSRKGKWGGGFCEMLEKYKTPFILSNFNGTADDIDVLTHEMGHAFAFYKANEIEHTELRSGTYETCEVHSMSMEFFAHRYMEKFFGSYADDYRYAHLASSLTFIPYGTIVDYFQHIAYQNPDMTPAERNAAWAKLEKDFRPYMDAEGLPFFEEGRAWQIKAHIFERPFYYIDYCLAQTVALQFFALMNDDYEAAWKKYYAFVSMAGTRTFVQILKESYLNTPFEEKTLKTVSDIASKKLKL